MINRTINTPLLWVGRTATFLADQLHEVALITIGLQLTASSSWSGILVLFSRAPFWILGWLIGVYVDRYHPRKSILLSACVCALCSFAVFLIYIYSWLSVAIMIVFVFLFSLARAAEQPAWTAQLALALRDRQGHRRLNIILDNTKRVARFVGPWLFFILGSDFSFGGCYVYIGGAFLLMALCTLFVSFPTSLPITTVQRRSFLTEIVQSWQIVRRRSYLLRIFVAFGIYNLTYAGCLWISLPLLSRKLFDQVSPGYPLAIAAFSGGGLLCNLLLAATRRSQHARYDITAVFIGFLLVGAGFFWCALTTSTPTFLMSLAVSGSGLPLMDTGIISLINKMTSPALQGRVFSIFRYFAEFGLAMGIVIASVINSAIGPQLLMLGLGGLVIPVVIIGTISLKQGNRHALFAKKA